MQTGVTCLMRSNRMCTSGQEWTCHLQICCMVSAQHVCNILQIRLTVCCEGAHQAKAIMLACLKWLQQISLMLAPDRAQYIDTREDIMPGLFFNPVWRVTNSRGPVPMPGMPGDLQPRENLCQGSSLSLSGFWV